MDGKQKAAAILRAVRERHHLTQRDLARMANVPQPTISAIESGGREPSLSLLSSIVEAAGESLQVTLAPASPFSGVETSRKILQIVNEGGNVSAREDSILRRALTFRDVIRSQTEEQFERLVIDPPSLIGDPRWDAFLAATVEEECARRDLAPPRWVNDHHRFVKPFWFLSANPALHQWEFETAPAAFVRHGIFAAADELASV